MLKRLSLHGTGIYPAPVILALAVLISIAGCSGSDDDSAADDVPPLTQNIIREDVAGRIQIDSPADWAWQPEDLLFANSQAALDAFNATAVDVTYTPQSGEALGRIFPIANALASQLYEVDPGASAAEVLRVVTERTAASEGITTEGSIEAFDLANGDAAIVTHNTAEGQVVQAIATTGSGYAVLTLWTPPDEADRYTPTIRAMLATLQLTIPDSETVPQG